MSQPASVPAAPTARIAVPNVVKRRLAVAFLTAMLPAAAQAQVVEGHLYTKGTRQPIVLAVMALLDTTMTPVARTVTNESGAFALVAPGPGSFYVAGHSPGFKRGLDGILDLGPGGHVTIDFFLEHDETAPAAAVSESSVPRRDLDRRYLEEMGFFRRVDQGAAWFLMPEDIRRSVAPDLTSLFQRAPLIRVLDGTPKTLVYRGGVPNPNAFGNRAEDPQGYCTPRVIVDGTDMPVRMAGIPGAMIESAVDIRTLLAAEVHNGPTSLPAQYAGQARGSSCATILLWTTRG